MMIVINVGPYLKIKPRSYNLELIKTQSEYLKINYT